VFLKYAQLLEHQLEPAFHTVQVVRTLSTFSNVFRFVERKTCNWIAEHLLRVNNSCHMSVRGKVTFHNTFSVQFPHILQEVLSPEVVSKKQLPNKQTYRLNHHMPFRLYKYEQ
jgi:hypothetical protein